MKKIRISKLSEIDAWQEIEPLTDFAYPWRRDLAPQTEFRAYYDTFFLHFEFTAHGPSPYICIKDNNKLDVRFSERVEIFFRQNEDMCPYYVLEIDPSGRVLDYKAEHYRKFDRVWQWPDNLELVTEIHDGHYIVRGKINLSTLNNLGLINENKIQLGLYRGHCIASDKNGGEVKWMSWINPDTENPDFHVPSSFGILELT